VDDDFEDLEEINFVFDGETIDLPPSGAVKNPFGDTMDKMVDGTLFRCAFLIERAQYRVSSYTPVEGFPKPLNLNHLINRHEAEDRKQGGWMRGLSTDTAALEIGIEKLTPQIAFQVRKLREEELVAGELEQLPGFGSF
jgi:hypothetical protein